MQVRTEAAPDSDAANLNGPVTVRAAAVARDRKTIPDSMSPSRLSLRAISVTDNFDHSDQARRRDRRPVRGRAQPAARPGPALPPTAAAADEALRDPKGPNRHSGAAAAGRAWPAGAALAGCQWASVSNFKFKIARNRDTDSGVGPDSVGLIPGRSAVGVGPKRPLARLGSRGRSSRLSKAAA